jgi:hypothetical protein
MNNKGRARAVYLATVASMIALTGGFVMASTIGTIPSPPAQGGGYTSAGTPPAGVVNTATKLSQAGATGAATTNSLGSPKVLSVTTTSGTDTINVNAITASGDYVQTVTLTLTSGSPQVAASQEYAVSIFIGGATGTPQTTYIETSATFGSSAVDTVVFQYDIGNGTSSITITSVSDLITQCSSVGSC